MSDELLAALIVVPLVGGRPALLHLLRRMVQWRAGLRWYALRVAVRDRPTQQRMMAIISEVTLDVRQARSQGVVTD